MCVLQCFFKQSFNLKKMFCSLVTSSFSFGKQLSPFLLVGTLAPAISSIIIRVSLVVITLAIAIFLPHFALIAALMGSFQTVFFGFCIPLLVHLKVKYHELSRLQIFADVIVLVFSSAFSVLGNYFSIKALVQARLNRF